MEARVFTAVTRTAMSSLAFALAACGAPTAPTESPRAQIVLPPATSVDITDAGSANDASEPTEKRTIAEARAVLVISIDGLRHDYLDDANHAPVLFRLMHEGARATTMKSVWPSLTYPAHTTLVTGTRPITHGIFNNVTFDPYGKNEGGWYWYTSDIRVPTLWDAARDAGIDVGNVYWPVTVGADIKWSIPQFWRAKTDEDDKLLTALSTRDTLPKDKPVPAEHRSDRERADAAITIIREHRPHLLFVYLTDLDSSEHGFGPMSDDALATLKKIDGYVDDVMTAARAAYPKLSLALVSDHGFASVTKDIRPNVALREKGFLTAQNGKIKTYRATTWKAGGAAAIMPASNIDAKTRRAVHDLFVSLAKDPKNGILKVVTPDASEKMGGLPGSIVALEARPGFQFSEIPDPPLVSPSHYKGMHGYAPDEPDMGATLFFWGDGISPRTSLGAVDMIDVAPTIAKLLDVKLERAEGKTIDLALAR